MITIKGYSVGEESQLETRRRSFNPSESDKREQTETEKERREL